MCCSKGQIALCTGQRSTARTKYAPTRPIAPTIQPLRRSSIEAEPLHDQTRQQLLAVIAKEAERLARITSDILTTESLAGDLSLTLEVVDLRTAVADAVLAAEAGAPDGVEVVATVPDAPVEVVGDRTRLQQVLTNLLDNAIKYSPEGGEIEARLDSDEEYATIEVRDHGIGIPDEAREDIFRRFYRVDPTLTGGVGGSGLGLYISRQLVEAMGGRIGVEPNQPRGSRFLVSLPRRPATVR